MSYTGKQKAEWVLGRYLSLRPRSEQEVRRYLQKKVQTYGLMPEDIDSIVEKYTRLGFIDDQKFAESLSHSVIHNKKKGPVMLSMKLKMAGVSKELISEAVGNISKEEIVLGMENRLAKFERKLFALEKRDKMAKAYQILFSSGFPSSEIRPFLDEWMKKEYHKGT